MAVSAAALLGVERIVAPSAGNAAVALSAYGREAGKPVLVAMPVDTPRSIVDRCEEYGGAVHLVETGQVRQVYIGPHDRRQFEAGKLQYPFDGAQHDFGLARQVTDNLGTARYIGCDHTGDKGIAVVEHEVAEGRAQGIERTVAMVFQF